MERKERTVRTAPEPVLALQQPAQELRVLARVRAVDLVCVRRQHWSIFQRSALDIGRSGLDIGRSALDIGRPAFVGMIEREGTGRGGEKRTHCMST